MAYRINATTEADKTLLDRMKDLAWREHKGVSQVLREAFEARLEQIEPKGGDPR